MEFFPLKPKCKYPRYWLYNLNAPTRWQCDNVIVAVDDGVDRLWKGLAGFSEDVNYLLLGDSVEPGGVCLTMP